MPFPLDFSPDGIVHSNTCIGALSLASLLEMIELFHLCRFLLRSGAHILYSTCTLFSLIRHFLPFFSQSRSWDHSAQKSQKWFLMRETLVTG